MNKPDIEEKTTQLAANPKLMRAYQCVREAAECIDSYIDETPKSAGPKGKRLRVVCQELDGVLPNFWSNLAELIVADIDAGLNDE